MERTYPFKDMVHLFILTNGEEEVERWIDELVNILRNKQIRCLKEKDFTYVGENVFASLERSINLAENVMVVFSKGFLRTSQLMYNFNLVLKHSINRNIPFLPVISLNITPPKEIDILECLRVDFSIFPLQKDIEKIERSVFRKKVTVLEIEHYLLGFEEILKAASPEVLSDLAKSAPFKRICFYLDEIRSNRPLHVGIKRSKSDVSCMKNVKTVRGCKKRNAILKSHSFHYKTSVLCKEINSSTYVPTSTNSHQKID